MDVNLCLCLFWWCAVLFCICVALLWIDSEAGRERDSMDGMGWDGTGGKRRRERWREEIHIVRYARLEAMEWIAGALYTSYASLDKTGIPMLCREQHGQPAWLWRGMKIHVCAVDGWSPTPTERRRSGGFEGAVQRLTTIEIAIFSGAPGERIQTRGSAANGREM